MSIFAKVKKSKRAADQQQKEPLAPEETTASEPTPAPASAPPTARPSLSRASTDIPNGAVAVPKNTYTPQRPSNLRTSSSSSVKSLPPMPLVTRNAASEPNLASRGRPASRTSSDLSIDSVMMSRSQNPSPSGRMVLQTRQSDFLPTMYTYDPSKAPNLSGRKRQHKSYRARPATRASSFVRSPHISTMVEENEEADEQAGSSSSSTKSNSSDSSTQSQYLEMARTASNCVQQQQDAATPEIPARNPARNSTCSQRASISSAHEIKYDSVAASIKSVEEEKATPVAPAATDRTESPGPKSKKRNWFSKKRAAGPIEAH